jgi:hypothetical protein
MEEHAEEFRQKIAEIDRSLEEDKAKLDELKASMAPLQQQCQEKDRIQNESQEHLETLTVSDAYFFFVHNGF